MIHDFFLAHTTEIISGFGVFIVILGLIGNKLGWKGDPDYDFPDPNDPTVAWTGGGSIYDDDYYNGRL